VDVVLPEVALVETDLMYPEHPVKIFDQKDRVTQHKTTKFFKLQWSNHTEEEATWESEDFLRSCHRISLYHRYGVCNCSLPLLVILLH
jgi:hypothetical protein